MEYGGDAHTAAERYEHQHLYPAVADEVAGAAVGDALEAEIAAHIGIAHVGGDVVVEPPRLVERIGKAFGQLCRQNAKIGRERDVRKLLFKIEIRLVGAGRERCKINVVRLSAQAVLRREIPILRERLLKKGDRLRRRRRRDAGSTRR